MSKKQELEKEERIKKIVTVIVVIIVVVAILLCIKGCNESKAEEVPNESTPTPTASPEPTPAPTDGMNENDDITDEGYYNKPESYEGHSIADALEGVVENNSYFYRVLIAAANEMTDYIGTAEQNLEMLDKLKNGELKAVSLTETYDAPEYVGYSIVDALYGMGVDPSYYNRAIIAAANGINGYYGSAEQNTNMLELLLAGELKKTNI